MNKVVHSSIKHDWATPRSFFAEVSKEFRFHVDVCADVDNSCCDSFWDVELDGLSQNWGAMTCWMNPPFGPGIGKWVKKAYESSQAGATVVALLPARTDTRWWHAYVMQSTEVRFIKGRMRFSGAKINAPFPCCLVVFSSVQHDDGPKFSSIDRILDEESVWALSG